MAHNVLVPMAFEFRPRRATWSVARGQITGWRKWRGELYIAEPEIVVVKVLDSPMPRAFVTHWRCLPAEVLERCSKSEVLPDIAHLCQDRPIELLKCTRLPPQDKPAKADPWLLRSEFLRLKRTTKGLLGFLNNWGDWHFELNEYLSESSSDELHELNYDDQDRVSYVSALDIWHFQGLCREALERPAEVWLGSVTSTLHPSPRPQYPHLLLSANRCEDAIRTTITLDLLNRVKFRVCARPDCSGVFSIENQHKHKYCSQYCGHLESVRRQRRKAKRS